MGKLIDVRELMPDNWIYAAYSTTPVQFKCLSYSKGDSGQDQCNIETVDGDSRYWELPRPIPITEDFLRLGHWTKWQHTDKAFMDPRSEFEIEPSQGGGDMWTLYKFNEADGTRWFIRNLEYIHQLQNTCFMVDGYPLVFDITNPPKQAEVAISDEEMEMLLNWRKVIQKVRHWNTTGGDIDELINGLDKIFELKKKSEATKEVT